MRAAVVALLLVLAACGSGADEPAATPPPTKAATTLPTAKPTTAPPTGAPAPEALLRFRCEPNSKGVWKATGFLVNGGKTTATYQVTVFIGEPTGVAGRARTKQVPSIAPGGSVAFEITKIPAAKGGGTCHVQVLESR